LQEHESHPQQEEHSDEKRETWHVRAQNSIFTFLTIAASILFFHLLQYLGNISAFFLKILTGISPVIWGLVFAYLLTPISKFYEENLIEIILDPDHVRPSSPSNKKSPLKPNETMSEYILRSKKRIHTVSAVLTTLTTVTLLIALLTLIVPELSNSITGIVKELPSQVDNFLQDLESKSLFDGTTAGMQVKDAIISAIKSARDWLINDLPAQATQIAGYFYTGIKSVFNVIYNLVIGLILSLYIMIDNARLRRQLKQVTFSIFPERTARRFERGFSRGNRKLNGAIRGKMVDSLIIGLLCFTLLSICNILPWFQFPYPVLLAVIVGVTNVVPFFGPFVGAFITGVLVLFEDPKMTIPYVILIIILQQFDANYLDPHMVGGSIGLRPFWSIFACLLGNSILGVPGFVLGPPTVAFIYEIASEWTESRLREKNLAEEFHISPEPEDYSIEIEPKKVTIPAFRKFWYWWQDFQKKTKK